MALRDTDFIIAETMLCSPERRWTARDFLHINQSNVVRFFKQLIQLQILKREAHSGPKSSAGLKFPEGLLTLCVDNFDPWDTPRSFVSTYPRRTLYEKLVASGIDWYLGGLDGLRPPLRSTSDSSFTLLIPDKSLLRGEKFLKFQFALGIQQVKMGGNVYICTPKYWRFLKNAPQRVARKKVPSDFFTYLSLKNHRSPLARTQALHMEKILKAEPGSFLAWAAQKTAL